jgi:recombination protein RecT
MSEPAKQQQQTALAKRQEQVTTIRDLLEKSKSQIALALPRHLTPERLMRVAMTTIQKNPKLLEADPRTLIGAIIQCAQLGLEPDSILGHAYLVPFWNGQLGRYDVTFIAGYKGLIALAKRGGDVTQIHAINVYDKEPFIYEEGDNPKLKHTPQPPGIRGEGKAGTYAVSRNADGQVEFIFMWTEEIEAIRDRALKTRRIDTADTVKFPREKWGPWGTDEDEMFKKTAIRRLSKILSLSPEFQKAAALDEMAEIGIPQNLDQEVFLGGEGIVSAEMGEIAGRTAAKADELKAKLDAKKAEEAKGAVAGAEKGAAAGEGKAAPAAEAGAGKEKGAGEATPPTRRKGRSSSTGAPGAPGPPPQQEDTRHGPTPEGPEAGEPFPDASPPSDKGAPPTTAQPDPANAASPGQEGPQTPEDFREAISGMIPILAGTKGWNEETAFKALLAGSGLFGKYTFEQFQKGEIGSRKDLEVLYRLGVASTAAPR